MIFVAGLVVAGIIVIIAMRLAGRKGRLIRREGNISAKRCSCGKPAGLCTSKRLDAEHPSGLLGPRKKKKK